MSAQQIAKARDPRPRNACERYLAHHAPAAFREALATVTSARDRLRIMGDLNFAVHQKLRAAL